VPTLSSLCSPAMQLLNNLLNVMQCIQFLFFFPSVFFVSADRGNDFQRPYRGGYNDRRGGGGGYYNRDRDSGYSSRGKNALDMIFPCSNSVSCLLFCYWSRNLPVSYV
jgi:hypothetical protein